MFGQGQTPIVITAKRLEIDGRTSIVHAKDNVVLTRGDAVITAREAFYRDKEKEISLEGDIVATEKDLRLTCRKAIFYNVKDIISAEGDILVDYQEYRGGSNLATYDIKKREIILTGNPWLTRGEDRLVSDKLVFYLTDRKVSLQGKSKATLKKGTKN